MIIENNGDQHAYKIKFIGHDTMILQAETYAQYGQIKGKKCHSLCYLFLVILTFKILFAV